MKYKKTFFSVAALILALAFSLGLTSCAKKGDGSLSIAIGSVGKDIEILRSVLDTYEERTGQTVEITQMPASTTDIFGQFKIWLNAKSKDLDLYVVDVIWAPQIDNHLIDLSDAAGDVIGNYFPSIVESQTVNDRLVALPYFTDAPALYYRKDLLEKHGEVPPSTWDEMTDIAEYIMGQERAEGNADMYGFVFQGNAYEGLTCDALEWVKSHGGGQIIEPDGTISINNEQAARALELAASWVGNIAPEGVTTYQEEEARGVWQRGNAVFMRNWPYAYSLGESAEDSQVKGKIGIVPLPSGGAGSAATLGGWNIAVSKYSRNQDAATQLALYLVSEEVQKINAIEGSKMPTLPHLYDDAEVLEAVPFFADWRDVLSQAVPRPSAPTKVAYNEVSKEFWTAAHNVLTGRASAEESLRSLEERLNQIKGSGW